MSNHNFDYCKSIATEDFKLIRKQELAQMLGVSGRTIYRMVKAGSLPEPRRSPKGYLQGWCYKSLQELFK